MSSAPASSSSSPFDGVVEFFTLARASAQLARLGENGRKQMADVLALGRQRAEAAETLWSNGHTAEALRLGFAALEATLDAAVSFADALKLDDAAVPSAKAAPKAPEKKAETPAETAPAEAKTDAAETKAEGDDAAATKAEGETQSDAAPAEVAIPPRDVPPSGELALGAEAEAPKDARAPRWRAALIARGTGAAKIERVGATIVAMADAKLPALDADVSPALADLFQRAMDARHVVDAAIGAGAWTTGDMRWARVRRWSGAAIAVAGTVLGLYFGLHEPEGTFASASDVWQQSATFSADMAIDGRPDTWWLLPDRATGWVEQRMSPSRRVETVTVINTANPPSLDRGTQDYRIEIYSGGSLARSIDGHFDWVDSPQPITHEVHMDGVQRVRFVVRSYHRTGGGLAELQIH